MARRPNVLWICTDQQRYDTIAGLGNEHIRTPNLDRLRAEGTAFTHAFSQSPVCTPSRCGFLTGMYPTTIRGRQNGQLEPPDGDLLITRMLADRGYDCGLAGKLHLAACHGRVERRTDDGYRVFHWSHHPAPDWPENAYARWLEAQGQTWGDLYHVPDGAYAYPGIPTEYHQTTWCAEMALDFIDQSRDGPWLMSVNPFDPHIAFDPPPEYWERYDPDALPLPAHVPGELDDKPSFQRADHHGSKGGRGKSCAEATDRQLREVKAAYYAMIEHIDHHVGRLLDHLDATGQREDTIVIFQSDHGEMLGDHGILQKGPYFYDCLTRVPLIVSWPGQFEEGLLSDALVELTDLAPTLMEAAGDEPPVRMQGQSLTPILRGEANPHKHRESVYCDYLNAMPCRRPPAYGTMYRDREWKVCVYHGDARGEGELYDLQADPGEHTNLWYDADYAEQRLEYTHRCFDRSVFTIDPWPPRVGRF